jgi:hypothetical protein
MVTYIHDFSEGNKDQKELLGVPGRLATQAGERSAWDSYRRLVSMFAKTVLGWAVNAAPGRFRRSRCGRRYRYEVNRSAF